MVQRKQARKKPKDPADDGMPPRGRGGGDPGSRGGSGRGAAVGGASSAVPNYMRATSCSGAKAGRAEEADPAPPPPPLKRDQVAFAEAPRAGRPTCSSSLRGPAAAGAHACAYAYCSLKGRAHASSAAAPLGAFLAASRRRLIKTQQSMKLQGASPFRKPSDHHYFVEVRAGAAAASSRSDSTEETEVDAVGRRMEYLALDHQSRGGEDEDDAAVEEDKAKDSGAASVDGSCGSSGVVSDGPVEHLGSTARHRGREGKEEASVVDHADEEDDFGACKSDISVELDGRHQGSINEDFDAPRGSSSRTSTDGVSSCALSGVSFEALSGVTFEDVSSACADAASSFQRKNFVTVRRRRTSEEGVEQIRGFNPKAPNFLPVETGAEAEKVALRHQMMGDRRNAEEWMVDYALRKAVKKMARAQKRKVEMLVQAFETVVPTNAGEKSRVEQGDDKKSFTLERPSQACI